MKYMVPVLAALSLIPTVYYFFLIRRIIRTAGQDPGKPVFVVIELALCAVIWHFICHITDTPAILLLLFLMIDALVLLSDFIIRKITGKPTYLSKRFENDGSAEKPGTARKIWRIVAGFCILPLAFALYSFLYGGYNIRNTVEKHYTVTTEKAVPAEGFRVCFASDMHCGVALKEEDYQRICKEIESKEPDLLILGGDLLDFASDQAVVESMFAAFGSVKTSCGIYYIFGNHDRTGDYKESVFTEEYIIDQCEKNGITVLQDRSVDLGNGIVLVGREDADTKYGRIRKTYSEVMEGVDSSKFVIVADHQPKDYAGLAELGADLILNGHLHAGQIFPLSIVVSLGNSEHVAYGRYRVTQTGNHRMDEDGPAAEGAGTATAIVSSGLVGFAYAIRTTGPSEYCMIDITGKTA